MDKELEPAPVRCGEHASTDDCGDSGSSPYSEKESRLGGGMILWARRRRGRIEDSRLGFDAVARRSMLGIGGPWKSNTLKVQRDRSFCLVGPVEPDVCIESTLFGLSWASSSLVFWTRSRADIARGRDVRSCHRGTDCAKLMAIA